MVNYILPYTGEELVGIISEFETHKERLDQAIGALTEDSEVVVARGNFDTLYNRLDNVDEKINQKAGKVKVASIEKELRTFKNTIANVNVNQEARQSVSGYGVVSLPKSAANGQVSSTIKGLTATNIIKNGNFADGVTGWVISNLSNLGISNGFVELENTTGNEGYMYTRLGKQSAGRKLYVVTTVQAILNNTTNVIQAYDGTSYKSNIVNSGVITQGLTKIVSGIYTTSGETDLRIRFFRTIDIGKAKIGRCMVIDLTATFGTGNEPTVEECDKIFTSCFDGTKSTISASRLKCVGKNLFDKNKIQNGYILVQSTGNITSNSNWFVSGYIDIDFLNSISTNTGVNNADLRICFYNKDKTFISGNWHSSGITGFRLWEVPIGSKYIRISEKSTNIDSIQVGKDTVATPYEPHVSSTAYLPNVGELRSLPNGTKDEVRVSGGKAEHIQRNKKYVLQTSDILYFGTGTNTDFVTFKKPLDYVSYGTTPLLDSSAVLSGVSNGTTSYTDDVSKIWKLYGGSISEMGIIIPKGTYTDLASAKIALVGLEITYQLAEPIETPIEVSGTLISYPSGTIYVENAVADAGIYTDRFTILQQDCPIKEIERIAKVDFMTGVETEIDASQAIIAGDKLSFTHPYLADGDIVFVTYFYDREGTQGETTIEFYDSRHTLKDSVTGKFYKVVPTVANGVLTNTLVEV